MCCMQLTENTVRKKSPSAHHHTTLSSYILATKACLDSWKKLVKQQYLFHVSPQYGELNFSPLMAEICLGVWGTPANFNGFYVGFVTVATSLNGGQPNFARSLAISWAGTLYIHFWGCCRLMEFCQLQNSLCVQVLRSFILAVLLHSTPTPCCCRSIKVSSRHEY